MVEERKSSRARALAPPVLILGAVFLLSLAGNPGCGGGGGNGDGGGSSSPTPTPVSCQALGDDCFVDENCCAPGICVGADPATFQPGTCLAPPAG